MRNKESSADKSKLRSCGLRSWKHRQRQAHHTCYTKMHATERVINRWVDEVFHHCRHCHCFSISSSSSSSCFRLILLCLILPQGILLSSVCSMYRSWVHLLYRHSENTLLPQWGDWGGDIKSCPAPSSSLMLLCYWAAHKPLWKSRILSLTWIFLWKQSDLMYAK